MSKMHDFVPGLELSRRLYSDVVAGLLGDGATRFVDACLARIDDDLLRSLPLVGGIDLFSDSTDMATPQAARAARVFLDQLLGASHRAGPSQL